MKGKILNISSRDKRKYFLSLVGKEKLEMAIEVVSSFINTNSFTQEINSSTLNLVRAATYILERQSKGKNSYRNLAISFNVVMTLINNNYKDYMVFSKLFKHKIKYTSSELCIGEYIIKTSDSEELFSHDPNDLFWIYENNQLYLVLSKQHSANNDLDTIITSNKFNFPSVKLPLVHKNNISTPILNGKDWVKTYTLKKEIGYLYFIKAKIKNQNFYKVGISKSKERFKYKNIEIIESNFIEMTMLRASIIEQYIHLSNSDRRLYIGDIDNTFEGKNECYHIDLYKTYSDININKCLDKICEYKDYDKNILLYALNSQESN